MNAPLAERMRPKNLEAYVGQEHLLGEGKALRRAIEGNLLPSMILWGPPGVGKTSLALMISTLTKREFYHLSAINSGVKDLREILKRSAGLFSPILFIDEIHRYNKSQQDALLAAVEKGEVTLIGATTENPSFEVNSALLSRCQVYVLESLGKAELQVLLDKALKDDVLLKTKNIRIQQVDLLFIYSGGDARKLYNTLEIVVQNQFGLKEIVISDAAVKEAVVKNMPSYDKSGEQHYDIISAFIKSMRGSDPHAALYWLARMLVAGEDPKFIARRMLILASEDIGNANPTALILANSCMDAVHKLGYPECRIPLSQTAIYLATSAKSNASYLAIDQAIAMAEKTAHLPVPISLRNAPTSLMKELGYGKEYAYSHDFHGNFVRQNFFPDDLKGTKLYKAGENAKEQEIEKKLAYLWAEWYGY